AQACDARAVRLLYLCVIVVSSPLDGIVSPDRERIMSRFEPTPDAGSSHRANGLPRLDPSLSVVVPCYDEEEVLAELHRRVVSACEAVTPSYEVVLVNDGSRDRTWARMVELAARDPHLVLVNLSRNHGHQLALTAGLSVCRGDRVLVIDADLQDPPELLPEMMRLLDAG